MPAVMSDIRKAIVARLEHVPGITTYWYDPNAITAPAVFVMPDDPFVNYQTSEWMFCVIVAVEAVDEEQGQERLDEYLSTDPGSWIVPALNGRPEEFEGDPLSRITPGDVMVTRGGRYKSVMKDFTRYQVAEIKARLYA